MSHIVTIQTKVHDPAAVAAACQRLQLPAPVQGTAQLFSGQATGLLVQLPGWQYPVVIDPSITPNGATTDTFITDAAPTTSYGTATYLWAGYNGANRYRSLLYFNVSSAVPSNSPR